MLLLAPLIAYLAILASNFILGLIHGLICLRLIEVSDYRFIKVTQKRVTLNALYPTKAERFRRRMKTSPDMQWIDTDKIASSKGRVLGYTANGVLSALLTIQWIIILGLPVFLVWHYTSGS